MTLTPIVQQMLKISSLRDIKALRIHITQAVNIILGINNSVLIHRLEHRNTSGASDEPTSYYAYHKTSPQGDILIEPIPTSELNYDWPTEPSFPGIIDQPNILPMKTDEGIVEYILFYTTTLDEESITNIDSLTSIYCNQCELILSSEQDQLTGLYNRRAFTKITSAMFSTSDTHSLEYHQLENSAYLAMVDLDHFKKVNDKFGHSHGDEVLVMFTQMVKNSLRTSDYFFRHGGEEFIIILNDTNAEQAFEILNRLRQDAESFQYSQIESISISIGYAPLEKELGISRVIDMADDALYFSKKNGRNQVNNYHDLYHRGLITDHADDPTVRISHPSAN